MSAAFRLLQNAPTARLTFFARLRAWTWHRPPRFETRLRQGRPDCVGIWQRCWYVTAPSVEAIRGLWVGGAVCPENDRVGAARRGGERRAPGAAKSSGSGVAWRAALGAIGTVPSGNP